MADKFIKYADAMRNSAVTVLVTFFLFLNAAQGYASFPTPDSSPDGTDEIFWFVLLSDTHVGYNAPSIANLQWLLTEAREVIDPSCIINAGDLVSMNFENQWETYSGILESSGVSSNQYFDLTGNHDQFMDTFFQNFLTYGTQGVEHNHYHYSWTMQMPFGSYQFIALSTNHNVKDNLTGASAEEIAYLEDALKRGNDADLKFVIGHHPIEDFLQGREQFSTLLLQKNVSAYLHGHTHTVASYWDTGVLQVRSGSLGGVLHEDAYGYAVIAVDQNGLSVSQARVAEWPVLVITTPIDRSLGGINHKAKAIYQNHELTPVRTLVFDEGEIKSVRFRINGEPWIEMKHQQGPIWQGHFSGLMYQPGPAVLEVQAEGSAVASNRIEFDLIEIIHPDTDDDDDDDTVSIDDEIQTHDKGATDTYTSDDDDKPAKRIIEDEERCGL